MKGAEQMLEKAMTLQGQLSPRQSASSEGALPLRAWSKRRTENMTTRSNTCGRLPSNSRGIDGFAMRSAGCSTFSGSMKPHSPSFRKH